MVSKSSIQKKDFCVVGDVYGVLMVPRELQIEKDRPFELKLQLPNVGKAMNDFLKTREVREFFSGALVSAMTKVVLGPLETIRKGVTCEI
ncbi:hypothetical protein ACHQM5_030366 [Ranunculus cassubicifolius]